MAVSNSIIFICSRALHSFLSIAALSHRLHRHPSVAQGHLHTIHPTEPRSTPYSPSTYIRHQHLSSHTVLFLSLHIPKPFQYSLIRSTSQLAFYTSSPMHLFIPNSIHSWHSNQTSQTLHLKNIHFLSLTLLIPHALLRTMPLVQLLLHIDTFSNLPQSSIVQHTFERSPRYIPLINSVHHIRTSDIQGIITHTLQAHIA